MVKFSKTLLLICALCCVSEVFAQIPMGGWQTFFNYNNIKQVKQSAEKIYAISDGNLFSVDKEYESIETYTKLTGLSDGNITLIDYCDNQNTLIIVYDNCNIDLLKGYDVVNVPDLKSSEVGSKKVYNITVDGKYAYLSCGFGIMVVDVEKGEVTDSYIIGDRGEYLTVQNITFNNDSIYAHTTNGVRYASKKDRNLADFTHWKQLELPNITSKQIEGIYSFNNNLLIQAQQTLFQVEDTLTSLLPLEKDERLIVNNRLIVSGKDSVVVYNEKANRITAIAAGNVTDALYDPQGKAYWIGTPQSDGQTLLQKYDPSGTLANHYAPSGPYSSTISFVKFQGGKLFTGSGGPFDRAMNTAGVVQIYENNHWSIITEVGMDTAIIHDNQFADVLDIAVDPQDSNHYFAASWRGVFEFQGNTLVNNFTSKNSPIASYWIMHITDGMSYDKEGNLWIASMFSQNPIIVYTADKEWVTLDYADLQNQQTIKETFLDSKGYLWTLLPRSNQGIFCADLNGTPLNYHDDKTKFISRLNDKDGHSITPSTFRCITEDKDGIIWIGTDKGPMLISDPSKVFSQNFIIDRIKITREDNANYADYLLENEQINAIAIDGNNRKWVATNSSGLYLLSADGKETIEHFTTENSPFTSNTILDLAINNENGELYIVTSNALFLYKTDATEGNESYKNVYVYPNPVRETFEGDITINGLIENSLVRISDAEGRIIHQGHSNGGTYVWDGKNLNGRRVDTGIYFIYAAQSDGSSKMVTKVAFIK